MLPSWCRRLALVLCVALPLQGLAASWAGSTAASMPAPSTADSPCPHDDVDATAMPCDHDAADPAAAAPTPAGAKASVGAASGHCHQGAPCCGPLALDTAVPWCEAPGRVERVSKSAPMQPASITLAQPERPPRA